MIRYNKYSYVRMGFIFCALVLFLATVSMAHAAGTAKVDRMLQQAMDEPENKEPIAAEPVEEEVVEEVVAEPPIEEEEIAEEEIEEEIEVAEEDVTQEEAPKPLGFAFGGLQFLPSLTVTQEYDDNIMAADTGKFDDFITVIRPKVHAEMLDSKHQLALDLMYETRQHWEYSDETTHDYSGKLYGRIGNGSVTIPYKAYYRHDHETREEDLTRQLPDEMIIQEKYGFKSGVDYQTESFGFKLLGHFMQEKFHDGRTPLGVNIIRDDADRETWTGETEVSWHFLPGHSVSIGGSLSNRDYDSRNFQGGGFNGPMRDSEHYSVWAGLKTDVKSAFFGSVKVGFEERNYDDNTLKGIDNMLVDATLGWNVTDSTSIKTEFTHGHYEDDEVLNPIVQSTAGLTIEKSLWEDLLVTLGAHYTLRDFEEMMREDETYILQALLDYMISDRFSIGGGYIYSERDSDLADFDYDRNRFMLSLTGRL